MEAADELGAEVVCITSADLLFRAFQARAGLGDGESWILDELFPEPLPIVSVLDGHPHTLSFLAAVHGVPMTCLGVQRFGQSGDLAELYEHHQIDAESVIGAALDLLDA
jgi:pyruvate dehydrogenase E1 component